MFSTIKNRLGNSVIGCVLAAFALIGSSRANANVIYDTFGPGDSYDGGNAIYSSPGTDAFGGIVHYANQTVAVPFAAPYSANFESVTLATYYYTGTDIAKIRLMDSSNDFSPDIYLETMTGSFGTFGSVPTFTSTVHTPLVAGHTYWIAMEPGASDTVGLWFKNNLGIEGVFQLNPQNTGYIPLTRSVVPAMRVSVTLPEPTSLGLVGLAGMMLVHRKRSV